MNNSELHYLNNTLKQSIAEKSTDSIWLKAFKEYNSVNIPPMQNNNNFAYNKVFMFHYRFNKLMMEANK